MHAEEADPSFDVCAHDPYGVSYWYRERCKEEEKKGNKETEMNDGWDGAVHDDCGREQEEREERERER